MFRCHLCYTCFMTINPHSFETSEAKSVNLHVGPFLCRSHSARLSIRMPSLGSVLDTKKTPEYFQAGAVETTKARGSE